MHHAAVHLAFDDQRVHQPAAVLERDVAQDLHAAGGGIHLHLARMERMRVGHLIGLPVHARLEPRLDARRQRIARHASQEARDGAQLHSPIGAADAHFAIGELEVAFRRLELLRRDLERLVAHPARGELHRGAGRDQLAAREAAEPERHVGRVAGDHLDVLRPHAELRGADLRQGRVDSLSHRQRSGINRHAPAGRHAHRARFERPAAGAFHAVRDADADVASGGARGAATRGEAGVADRDEHLLLAAGVIAAVQHDRRAGAVLERLLVGHLRRRHEISPPHFRAVELQLAGHAIDQALHREARLRIARAAHRDRRHLVRLHHQHVERIGRNDIRTADRGGGVVCAVDALRRIGALIVHEAPAHAADLRVSIDRDLDVPDLVALLNRGKEVLHAVLDPLHRPAEQPRRGGDGDFFRIDEELGAEAAADIGGADADAIVGHAEERRERHPQIVRHLRRRPNRQAVFAGLIARDRAASFDRMRRAAVL